MNLKSTSVQFKTSENRTPTNPDKICEEIFPRNIARGFSTLARKARVKNNDREASEGEASEGEASEGEASEGEASEEEASEGEASVEKPLAPRVQTVGKFVFEF